MSGVMLFGGPPVSSVVWFVLIAEGFFLMLWILLSIGKWIAGKPWHREQTPEATDTLLQGDAEDGDVDRDAEFAPLRPW